MQRIITPWSWAMLLLLLMVCIGWNFFPSTTSSRAQNSGTTRSINEELAIAEREVQRGLKELDRRNFILAEKHFNAALKAFKAHVGEKDKRYFWILRMLGRTYLWSNRIPEAENALKKSAELSSSVLGKDHSDTIDAFNDLGGCYVKKEDWKNAISILELVRDNYRAKLGENHVSYAASLNNLGWLHFKSKNFGAAEPLFRQALDIYRKKFGEVSPYTADCYEKLARLLVATGRLEQAEQLFRFALAVNERTLDQTDENLALCMDGYSALLHLTGKHSEAAKLEERAKAIRIHSINQQGLRK